MNAGQQVKINDRNNAYNGRVATIKEVVNHAFAGTLLNVYVSNADDTSRVSFVCKASEVEAI